jgi:hypothetical protein
MPRNLHPKHHRCGRCPKAFLTSEKLHSHAHRAHPKPGQEPYVERTDAPFDKVFKPHVKVDRPYGFTTPTTPHPASDRRNHR